MKVCKIWINAFRLRTLPLSLSSIILASFLAYDSGNFKIWVFILALTTTLFLQILSNLANDYGDSKSGTDNINRTGPVRAVQSGEITAYQMKRMVWIFIFLSLISGIALIVAGTKDNSFSSAIFFLVLGFAAIFAALKYTIGRNPYGYKGLGDLFVFLFFGLTGVIGTYFLHTETFVWDLLLPATSVGLLSVGVLNINNLRDERNDKQSGKNTIVVLLGARKARIYHFFLIASAIIATIIYTMIHYHIFYQWLFLLTLPLFGINVFMVVKHESPNKLNHELKRLAVTTLFFSIAFGASMLF